MMIVINQLGEGAEEKEGIKGRGKIGSTKENKHENKEGKGE